MTRTETKQLFKAVLPNGIRVIGEEQGGFNSLTTGIFVFTGGRDEPPAARGIAHFTEHMLFKGTHVRSSLDISREIERIGGVLNAYTDKEYTCYYSKVVKDKLGFAVELLSDIFLNSTFPQDELEKEKQVVLQELAMVNDTPDDLVHDVLSESLYGRGALGESLLGDETSIKSFSRGTLSSFMADYYRNDRIVVACAGNFKWNEFLKEVEARFAGRPSTQTSFPERLDTGTGRSRTIRKKHLFQVHTAIGFKTCSVYDDDRYALKVLNTILGGGMSSLLFQELREKTGYAYSVYSYTHTYQDSGFLEIYFGTTPEHQDACMDAVRDILRRLRSGEVTHDDVVHAQEQVRGYSLIAQDSSDARFSYNARCELYHGRHVPFEQDVERIFKVTRDDIIDVANRYLSMDDARIARIAPHGKKSET